MSTSVQSTKVAVVAGIAVGVIITAATGELRAEPELGGDPARADAALERRLEAQEARLDAALAEIAELRAAAAGKPGTTKPGPSAPRQPPKGKTETEAEERRRFREQALVALAPELEAIEQRFVEAKKTFDKHYHEFDKPGHGWVKLDIVFDKDVIPNSYYHSNWVALMDPSKNTMLTKKTTTPKQKKG